MQTILLEGLLGTPRALGSGRLPIQAAGRESRPRPHSHVSLSCSAQKTLPKSRVTSALTARCAAEDVSGCL